MTDRLFSSRGLGGALLSLVLLATVVGAPDAVAQSNDLQGLSSKIDRLQRELTDMQRVVYQGAPPPKSTGAVGGDINQAQAARIELRMSQFESLLQSLTGQVEDLGFAIDGINRRLDSLAEETRQRLEALERQSLVAGQLGADGLPQAGALPPAGAGSGQPGTIGTLSQSDLQAFQASQGTQAPPVGSVESATQTASLDDGSYELPPGTPKEQYEYAFSLLRQANYEEARLALGAFLAQNAGDPLAGNAQYWLGETYYVQGDYNGAAVTFAEAFQAYPDGAKAPASLLKLGMALSVLGNKSDACGTFDELLRRYPNAQPTVMQKAKSERASLGCS